MTTMMSRTYGVVIGLVADVDDPDKLGRIRVTYPWLGSGADQATSKWVSIAVPLAGNDRGFCYLPEVDDEVLVAFDHGDVDHPFVIGFLHNGADTPPLDGIDKHVRRIKSVSGHIIDLDDRDGAEKVSVKTQGGHSLEMRDGDTTIEVATSGGQEITMTDSPAQIEVKTSTGTSVTISDLPSQVEVEDRRRGVADDLGHWRHAERRNRTGLRHRDVGRRDRDFGAERDRASGHPQQPGAHRQLRDRDLLRRGRLLDVDVEFGGLGVVLARGGEPAMSTVLMVPTPTLTFDDAGGGAAALEKPVNVLLGAVTEAGTPVTPVVIATAGFARLAPCQRGGDGRGVGRRCQGVAA